MDNKKDAEKREIEDAKRKASEIVKEAEDCAREIHVASLLYVDEMLEQISLAAKSARESIEIIMDQAMEDLNQKIDRIEANKIEILEDLRKLSENGTKPIKKGNYEIKIADEWKDRIEHMLEEPEPTIINNKPEIKNEETELEEDGFKASDFDLDNEYFSWLEEKKQEH